MSHSTTARHTAGWEKAELLAILLVAATLRAGWPALSEFKFSEARLEALALEFTQAGRIPLVGVPSSAGFDHSPLSVYLYVPAFLHTTNPVFATVYGALINVGAVLLTWHLARRWQGGGLWAARITAILFAVSPWSVVFSRKIWQVAFVPVLAAACLGLLVASLVHGRRWCLAWAMLAYAVLVQVHPSAIAMLPALIACLGIFRRELALAPAVAGAGLALLSATPFIVHQFHSGWPVLAAARALPQPVWDADSLRLTWLAITGQGLRSLAGIAHMEMPLANWMDGTYGLVGWLFAASAVLQAGRLFPGWTSRDVARRQSAQTDLVLLLGILSPLLFNIRHSLELHLHFYALVLPLAFLVVGRAVETVLSWIGPTGARRTAATVAGAIVLTVSGLQVAGLLATGMFVSTHDTAGGFGVPLGHYLRLARRVLDGAGDGKELLVVAPGDSPVVDEIPAIWDVLLRGRIPVRFVDGRQAALFPAAPARLLLAPQAGEASTWYQEWPSTEIGDGYRLAELDGTEPAQAAFAPVRGLRLFQNGVEALGLRWQGAIASESVRVWLLWRVAWTTPGDSHFSIQLVDGTGKKTGQLDSPGYPGQYRMQGDRVISLFDITIGREEVAVVRVGQYRYPELDSIPVIDEAGNAAADAVRLDPTEALPQ